MQKMNSVICQVVIFSNILDKHVQLVKAKPILKFSIFKSLVFITSKKYPRCHCFFMNSLSFKKLVVSAILSHFVQLVLV